MSTTATFSCPKCGLLCAGRLIHDCGDDIEYETWVIDCPTHGRQVERV